MANVKGMTWGTPEFVKVAKESEANGDIAYKIGKIYELIEDISDVDIDISSDNKSDLRQLRNEISEILGDCEGW